MSDLNKIETIVNEWNGRYRITITLKTGIGTVSVYTTLTSVLIAVIRVFSVQKYLGAPSRSFHHDSWIPLNSSGAT